MNQTKPTVVVIDNNPTMKVLFERSTKTLGINLLFYYSAKESIRYLQSNIPDLIFLSLLLPDKSGLLLLEELRQIAKHENTRVIILSSKDYVQDRIATDNLSVVEFMTKPVPMRLISDAIIKYTGVSTENHHKQQ